MSSVTRLHLLSQCMLNVSCLKPKHRSSLPTGTLTESPMEFVGQPRPSGACSLLGVPGLSTLDLDLDDDEGEVVIGIRPKCSPLPRRRSSVSDEDLEFEPPLCGSRRVSFADAKGLNLVQVKEFDTWDIPKLPGYDSSEIEVKDAEEYFLSPVTFSLPLSTEELFVNVREQKVELETIELLPGTTILKGVIRVLNISFSKAVYIRTTLDTWSSHFDLLAEYIPGSSDSLTDCFSFKLTLVPPFGEQGARVDFCLRYETPVGTFWANNNNRNYVLFCHQRMTERKEKPKSENVTKKSCLKTVSQNFSTVENFSAIEDSSQENKSTDVSKHEEKVDTMQAKQMTDGQSGTSEEERQNLLAESRRNCSRRNRRKAARMARVRDFFAQRVGGENDTEGDETHPEAKQAAQEEIQEKKQSDVESFSEGSSKSDGSPFVSESLVTCSKPTLDVLHNTSPAHDHTSNSEPEKSERFNLADSATQAGVESATDIRDNPLHSNDDPSPAECQNMNKSVSKADESSQKQGVSNECASNTAAEPADSVIPAMSSESLVSKTNSFTFGTVVAPLYHQVFGRVGNECQSVGDWGNPVRATLNVGDLTQSYPHTERRETSCTVTKEDRGDIDKVQENVVKTLESKQESLYDTPNSPVIEEEETNLTMKATDILDHAETLQDPILCSDQRCTNTSGVPEDISGDTVVHPHTFVDLSNPQMPTESIHLQGEAQEDNVTYDLQSQTTTETAHAQLPEHTCAQIKTNLDETHAQSQTEEVMTSLETSFMSLQPSQRIPERLSDETDQQTSSSGSNDCKCVPQISPETHEETDDVEEQNEEAMMSNYHIHGDTLVELKDGDTLKHEEVIVSEKIEHREMEATVSKQEEFCVTDTSEVKNWEMMVEEEEKNILTDKERTPSSKAEDTEAVEKDQGEQLEDAGIETATENIDTREAEKEKTEDDMLGKITAAREEDQDKEADALEDKQMIGEEKNWELEAGKDREVFEREFEYVKATRMEKTAGEEELAEETEVEKREEQEETESQNEKHFAEMQEVNIEMSSVQEEEEVEGEEEMEIDLNDDNEAGVEREDQEKPREENIEEENPDYKDEIPVDETSVIVDTESESMTIGDRENEVGCFEVRVDITQNKGEDGLSALVNNVHDKRVTDKEDTGKGQSAHIPSEMHLYSEEPFHSNEYFAHDLSKVARDESEFAAAEGGSCIFAEEPESDQLSHDSISTESDSDDEVELYMHCLRAVHTGTLAHKDRNKDAGFSAGFSVSRSKLLSTPMPSISESLDEEQPLNDLQENHEDAETADIQSIAAALPASGGQESINTNASRLRETFSCSNISKTLIYATLLVLFVAVAYHYDFLACFGLYLISVIWLYCQGERQPVKKSNRIG